MHRPLLPSRHPAFTSGPSSAYTLLSDRLAAGYYGIETTLAPQVADATFQINFTSTPEPASFALVLGGLTGVTLLRRRKTARA